MWSLDTLVSPMSGHEFFEKYFENKHLVVRRTSPNYFSQLLSLDDIDRVLSTLESTDDDISVVNAAEKIDHSSYIYGDNTINTDQVFRLHHAGATIILNHLHNRHIPLKELCAELELEFSSGFQTNIYLTPAGAQGFKPHFDTHDVFVLQISGSKHWKIYDEPVKLALKGHSEHTAQHNPGPLSDEFVLNAGDTLYIPRGLTHDAVSTDETSLHITVGIMAPTWFNFMLEAVEALAGADHEVRKSLPQQFTKTDFDRAMFRETFINLVHRLADNVDTDQVLDRFTERFIDRRPPFLRGHMHALKKLDQIDLDTVVGCRPYLTYFIYEDDESIRVRFHHNEITLPRRVQNEVRFALETKEFRVCDLQSELDDSGKLVLVRRLVREGLLQILT